MDEVNLLKIKSCLRPLDRRLKDSFDKKALDDALIKLEERAIGEHLLDEIRPYLNSKSKKKTNSKVFSGFGNVAISAKCMQTSHLSASLLGGQSISLFWSLVPFYSCHLSLAFFYFLHLWRTPVLFFLPLLGQKVGRVND